MARNSLGDFLQSYTFWLMDIGPTDLLALPVLTPLFGFNAISMPEIQADTHEIKEGTWPLTKKVFKSASVSNITMQRGATWYDGDFWRWMQTAIAGSTSGMKFALVFPIGGPTYRRTLLLVQFFPHVIGDTASGAVGLAIGAGILAGNAGATVSPVAAAATLAATALGGLSGIGPFEFAQRLPAKAWLLTGCIPVRYKPGSDFDATSDAISIQEMEIAMNSFEEFSLGT